MRKVGRLNENLKTNKINNGEIVY